MKARIILAKIAITIAAAGVLLLLRPDLATWLTLKTTFQYRYWSTPGLIEDYMRDYRDYKVRKLQLGAGENTVEGWLNTDIELAVPNVAYLDVTEPFPMPDNSFKFIYSEQLLEHISYEAGFKMLKESHRILAPGGVIRISTPNLLSFVALFSSEKTPDMNKYIAMKQAWHQWPATPDPECYIMNQVLREWGHIFVYSPKMLRARLQEAGFAEIVEVAVGESPHPELRKMEYRDTWAIRHANSYESMVLEATKR